MASVLGLRALVSGLVVLPIIVSALAVARIELPDGFDDISDRLAVKGFGGRNKGHFEFPGHSGEFSRKESRLGVFDPLLVSNSGKSSFSLTGEAVENAVSASCEITRKAVTIGIVTFDPKKMLYQCELRHANVTSMDRLLLGQPKASGFKERLLAQERRRGEALVLGQHFEIESVHRYQGSKFVSSAPAGYWIMQADSVVAAVELTDVDPVFYVRRDISTDVRRGVLAVALGLAVLRDPAHSALED